MTLLTQSNREPFSGANSAPAAPSAANVLASAAQYPSNEISLTAIDPNSERRALMLGASVSHEAASAQVVQAAHPGNSAQVGFDLGLVPAQFREDYRKSLTAGYELVLTDPQLERQLAEANITIMPVSDKAGMLQTLDRLGLAERSTELIDAARRSNGDSWTISLDMEDGSKQHIVMVSDAAMRSSSALMIELNHQLQTVVMHQEGATFPNKEAEQIAVNDRASQSLNRSIQQLRSEPNSPALRQVADEVAEMGQLEVSQA